MPFQILFFHIIVDLFLHFLSKYPLTVLVSLFLLPFSLLCLSDYFYCAFVHITNVVSHSRLMVCSKILAGCQ